ncbi:MAG TPA: hypothetical protein VN361_06820 [Oxalicibacterium sp.]|nr:hypothetical protein [Oxalicibacterium sp.]
MRNFVPLSLFAAAATLAVLGTPSFHPDRVAAAPPAYGFVPANDTERAARPLYAPTLQPDAARCEPRCIIRGPMT